MKNQVNAQIEYFNFLYSLSVISIIFGFFGCVECLFENKKNQRIDMGDIPSEIKECVPYQDGDTVKFIDSQGNVHLFNVIRAFEYHETSKDFNCHINYIKYQTDSLQLKSDTYNRVIIFEGSNYHPSGLNIIHSYSMDFKTRYFIVPISDKAKNSVDQLDSLIVNGEIYTDVFVINPTTYINRYQDSIHAEAIYYNYKYGMLKIAFSDSTHLIRKE